MSKKLVDELLKEGYIKKHYNVNSNILHKTIGKYDMYTKPHYRRNRTEYDYDALELTFYINPDKTHMYIKLYCDDYKYNSYIIKLKDSVALTYKFIMEFIKFHHKYMQYFFVNKDLDTEIINGNNVMIIDDLMQLHIFECNRDNMNVISKGIYNKDIFEDRVNEFQFKINKIYNKLINKDTWNHTKNQE